MPTQMQMMTSLSSGLDGDVSEGGNTQIKRLDSDATEVCRVEESSEQKAELDEIESPCVPVYEHSNQQEFQPMDGESTQKDF